MYGYLQSMIDQLTPDQLAAFNQIMRRYERRLDGIQKRFDDSRADLLNDATEWLQAAGLTDLAETFIG